MATQHELEQNRQAFAEAKTQAEAEGGQVCGTYGSDGTTPVYFVMPRGASEDEIEEKAFFLREGRLPTDGERTLGTMVKKHGKPVNA